MHFIEIFYLSNYIITWEDRADLREQGTVIILARSVMTFSRLISHKNWRLIDEQEGKQKITWVAIRSNITRMPPDT